MIITDLQKYFTKEAVGQVLKNSVPVRTPIWSRVFKTTRQHPLSHISTKVISETTGNVPMIKRGASSIGVHGGDESANLFEPQPIAINQVLKAKDFLDLSALNDESAIQSWVGEKLANMRDRVFGTIEALCCQAFVGDINYAIKVYDGDLGNYNVDFGPLIPASAYTGFIGSWKTAELSAIFKDLMLLINAIKLKTRYGNKIGILAGKDVYYALIGKLTAVNTSSTISLKIESDKLYLNGIVIEYMGDAGYTDLSDGTYVQCIGDDEIVLFAEDAPFTMNYLAIDDFDAIGKPSLVDRALFPKQIKQEDPSGYKLLVQSKPFPVPVHMATVRQKVI